MIDKPIYVCEQCGKISVALIYEDTDTYHCPFCKFEMIKTRFTTAHCSDIFAENNKQAEDLRFIIYQEYVRYSPNLDKEKRNLRLNEQLEPMRSYFKNYM